MNFNLTRKGLIAVIAIVILIIGGVTGYIVWRVNQQEQLSETDTEAGGGGGSGQCNLDKCDCKIFNPKTGKTESNCTLYNQENPNNKCFRYQCDNGAWIFSSNTSRPTACSNCGHNKPPVDKGGGCKLGSECAACDWPNVAFCSSGKCGCTKPENIPSNQIQCGSITACSPKGCPAGFDSCGTSADNKDKTGCTIKTDCTTACTECGNKSKVYRYCKPTTTTSTNVCDGGELIPSGKTTFDEGETVEIKGYAFDEDGVDKSNITVTVNGQSVGNATVVDACPSNNQAICNSVGADKNPVIWSYSLTPQEGDTTVAFTWKDTKGVGGSNCQASTTLTVEPVVETNPDWSLSKVGAGVCLNDGTEDASYRIDYTINVTNTGDGEGEIDKIVDTLDSKVESEFLLTETIDPSASVSGHVITWDLSGADGTFSPGQSKTYKYSLEIPDDSFGTYTNIVEVFPVEGETFEDTEVIVADCDAPPPDTPETPETGIFDNWLSRIGFGFLLIAAAMAYIGYMDGFNEKVATAVGEFADNFDRQGRVSNLRKRFERKVVKK